jgi:hypothetical protein
MAGSRQEAVVTGPPVARMVSTTSDDDGDDAERVGPPDAV